MSTDTAIRLRITEYFTWYVVLAAFALGACDVAPAPSPWLHATAPTHQQDACDDAGPCVDSFTCTDERLDEPACGGIADGACMHVEVRDGLDCFPRVDAVAPGKCSAGRCVQ